jgi:phosphoribosyl-ATP pyrophosphohydrolase
MDGTNKRILQKDEKNKCVSSNDRGFATGRLPSRTDLEKDEQKNVENSIIVENLTKGRDGKERNQVKIQQKDKTFVDKPLVGRSKTVNQESEQRHPRRKRDDCHEEENLNISNEPGEGIKIDQLSRRVNDVERDKKHLKDDKDSQGEKTIRGKSGQETIERTVKETTTDQKELICKNSTKDSLQSHNRGVRYQNNQSKEKITKDCSVKGKARSPRNSRSCKTLAPGEIDPSGQKIEEEGIEVHKNGGQPVKIFKERVQSNKLQIEEEKSMKKGIISGKRHRELKIGGLKVQEESQDPSRNRNGRGVRMEQRPDKLN